MGKMGKDINSQFTEGKKKMKVTKGCSNSLFMKETQIKPTLRYQFTSIRLAHDSKVLNAKCWQECWNPQACCCEERNDIRVARLSLVSPGPNQPLFVPPGWAATASELKIKGCPPAKESYFGGGWCGGCLEGLRGRELGVTLPPGQMGGMWKLAQQRKTLYSSSNQNEFRLIRSFETVERTLG